MSDAFIPPRAVRAADLRAMLGDHEIDIDAIVVPERLRLVDADRVSALAANFNEMGQLDAIAVAMAEGSNGFLLVDGEHRLEAGRKLGWTRIRAFIREMTPEEREKHEIYANLIRNELNALDRIVFVGRLAAIFERENVSARHGGDRKSKKWLEKNQLANISNWSGFNSEAARRTGLGEKSIRNTRALFDKLGPATIAALRSSPLADNAAQLKAVAETRPEERDAIVKALADGRASNVARAREAAGIVKRPDAEDAALTLFANNMARLDLKQLKRRLSILTDTIKLREDAAKSIADVKSAKAEKRGKTAPASGTGEPT